MPRRWLPILCAALLAAGCGSSSGADKSSSPAPTATATAAPTVHSPDLQKLPHAPAPSGSPPSSQGDSHNAFLRAAFDDAERLWHQEFHGAGMTYRPARFTIFTQQVHTACGTQSAQVGLRKHGNFLLSAPVGLQQRDIALPTAGAAVSSDWFDAERSDRASSPYAGGN